MRELKHYNPNHDPRNGQFTSGPGGVTTIKKGTRLNSVAGYNDPYIATHPVSAKAYLNRGRWTYLYDPDNPHDSKVYKGPFSLYTVMRGYKFIAEHKYKAVKDLNLASEKERLDEFKNLYEDKKYKKAVIKDLSSVQKRLVLGKVGSQEEQARYKRFNPKKITTEEDYKTAYEIFNHAMEAKHAYKSTTEYGRRVESKWDGMIDDNNRKVYNDAQNPVIIFKADQFLEKYADTTLLTVDEVMSNRAEIEKYLAKQGRKVKL